jgi:hypothetical protein
MMRDGDNAMEHPQPRSGDDNAKRSDEEERRP